MKRNSLFFLIGGMALLAAAASNSYAQQFSAPSCGNSLADSTCYTAPKPSTCSLPDASISQRGACPVGYVGMMDQRGTRNSCTGVVSLGAGSDDSGCTNCAGPLSQLEALNIQRAIFEVSEPTNLAYVNQVCSGGSCLDGASVNDAAGGQPIGRMFRDHVWVSQDGFSSGHLPTTNRIKYLAESGNLPANSPAFAFLPKDQGGGRPGSTNLGQGYSSAVKDAQGKGLTTCSGDGKSGCSISCSQPLAGWQEQFCSTKTVQHWSCSDSYAVNSGGSWQPTKDATVPYTAKGNYANKDWKWPEIFAWNSPSMGNAGGAVYMCNSTINACNGWVTQAATYKCRVPATYDCSYSGAGADGRPMSFSGSCQTCSVEMGAKWDFELAQANDCPATPLSSRASSNRVVWQADLAASSCPINGSGTSSAANPRLCPAGQVLDATGSTCSCKPGFSWSGSSCLPPAPPGSPPSLIITPLSFSKGVAYSGVVMGSLSNGSAITSLSLPPSATPIPSGMFTHFSGALALISGIPNANGVYNFSVKADYAAGVDSAGNKYPAGVTVSNMSVTITGCSATSISWSQGAASCSGAVGNSASVGTSATIASTSGAPAGAKGTNSLSCEISGGAWSSTSSSCSATTATTCPKDTIACLRSGGSLSWGGTTYTPDPKNPGSCTGVFKVVGSSLYQSSCPMPWGWPCDLVNGGKASQGQQATACAIYNNATYRQGLNYTCTSGGWTKTADEGSPVASCPSN